MTMLTSPSADIRNGGDGTFDFNEYLQDIVFIDKDIKSVTIKLDEEGNYWWELSEEEATLLAKQLAAAIKSLKKEVKP